MEVEKKVDELPAADPPAQPEEAAVPLAFWGPLGKGIHLGFGTLGYAFYSILMFQHLWQEALQSTLAGIWGQMFTKEHFYEETLYQKKSFESHQKVPKIDTLPSGL